MMTLYSRISLGYLLVSGCALLLSNCSDDTLAERKKACAEYISNGALTESEMPSCETDELTFRNAATKFVATGLEQMYPAMVEDAKAISASGFKAESVAYPPLPPTVKNPTFSDDANGAAIAWPATLDLQDVTFDAVDKTKQRWQISGSRVGDPEDTWMFELNGLGPTKSHPIDDVCFMLESGNAAGCKARVYVKNLAESGSDLEDLEVVAIDLTPPPKDEAYKTLLDNQMSRWPPKDHSK